jgi:hypothetical protein
MDMASRSVQLCVAGAQAEFDHNADEAAHLYAAAWQVATNDYDGCVAAHYLGHLESDPIEALGWHLEALERAQRLEAQTKAAFLPSLYVNLGQAYEQMGYVDEAARYYRLAADLGLVHHPT